MCSRIVFFPIAHVRELLKFIHLMKQDRRTWSWCLLWLGWLPSLSGWTSKTSWAVSHSNLAALTLETVLGALSC